MSKNSLSPDFNTAADAGFLTVDISREDHRELLRNAYDGVYAEAFPIESERVEYDLWLKLADADSQAPAKLSIILSGEDFHLPSRPVNGISVGMYYTDSQTAMIGYNAVSKQEQGKGLGTRMQKVLREEFQAIADSRSEFLRGIFVEVNDPEKVAYEDDSFDPQKRMFIYRKWGAFEVPVDYVQPALCEGAEKFYSAKLLYYPTKNELHPTVDAVKDFLRDMYRNYGYADPSADADFCSMMDNLNSLPFENLGFATDVGGPDLTGPA